MHRHNAYSLTSPMQAVVRINTGAVFFKSSEFSFRFLDSVYTQVRKDSKYARKTVLAEFIIYSYCLYLPAYLPSNP